MLNNNNKNVIVAKSNRTTDWLLKLSIDKKFNLKDSDLQHQVDIYSPI